MNQTLLQRPPIAGDMLQYYTINHGGPLQGELVVPGDKSITNRAIILGALAHGDTQIDGTLDAQDVFSTIEALRSMGVHIDHVDEHTWVIHGVGLRGLNAPGRPINCHHCGSTLRLMMGLLSGQAFDSVLIGDENLQQRNMHHIAEPLKLMGARLEMQQDATAPVHITGKQQLQGIKYLLPHENAQAKSSLLIAGLYAQGSTILVEPFVTCDHTEHLLKAFGYSVESFRPSITIKGGGKLRSAQIRIPGDISAAAYFMIAATLVPGSDILIRNVGFNPTRIGIINILRIMGGDITIEREEFYDNEAVVDLRVKYSPLHGVDVPMEYVPMALDELPVLFVAASVAKGVTVVRHASALRMQESDRIHNMADGLRRLGVSLETRHDGIVIEGGALMGGTVNSHGDPRVAMAFAVAGLVANERVIVQDCAQVIESFPNFVDLARQVGIQISVNSNEAT